MNKVTAIPILLIGAALLAGCSAPPLVDKEALYLKMVHENTASTADDAMLIKTAHAACDVLEEGYTVKDVSWVIATADMGSGARDEVSTIIGYAISQYCPELGGQ